MSYSLVMGYWVWYAYMSSTYKSGSISAAAWLCPSGQPLEERIEHVYNYSCCVSQERQCVVLAYVMAALPVIASKERINVFTIPTTLGVSFQPLS